MENTRAFHPTCFMLLKKRERRNKRATTDSPCIVLTVGGLKTVRKLEKMRRDWATIWMRPCSGQISCVCGVHTDFMKLISKQQLEEKARQRHMRTATEKGMRNATSLKEEEPAINWCVCMFSYTALHCPALSLFNLRGNFLVKLSWLTLLG